jgi:hypothetical protein
MKWIEVTEDESTLPPFGKKVLLEDSFGRYFVVTAREGEDLDYGRCSVDLWDEFEDLLDDHQIERWVLLEDILPKEEKGE